VERVGLEPTHFGL